MPRIKSGDRILGPYKERGGKQWRVVYCVGGSRQSETYASKRKADEAIAAARAELDPAAELWAKAERYRRIAEEYEVAASECEARGMTVADEIDAYNAYQHDKGCKDGSVDTARRQLRGVLAPVLGLRPRAITPNRAKKLYLSRTQQVAVQTHHLELQRAGTFWKWMIKQGHIATNPWQDIEKIGRPNKGKLQLRGHEAVRLYDECVRRASMSHPGFPTRRLGAIGVLCALILALRESEILSIEARDIDMGGTLLWIPDSKSEAGRRHLAVDDDKLASFLHELATTTTGRVFPFTRAWVRDWTKRLCSVVSIPTVCAHALRGTHSSLATEGGSTSAAVSRALGHASEKVTRDHYTKRASRDIARQARVLEVLDEARKKERQSRAERDRAQSFPTPDEPA